MTAILLLFAIINGAGILGVCLTWYDFDRPKGISIYQHIINKKCIKLFVLLNIIWVISSLIYFNKLR